MRHISAVIAVAIAGFMYSPALADDSPREIVERAIKARCPKEDKLDKQRIEIIHLEGSVFTPMEMPATRDLEVAWPDDFRLSTSMTISGVKSRIFMFLNGDKMFVKQNDGQPEQGDLTRVDEFKTEIYGRWMMNLYPLRDRGFTLTRLNDAKLGDEPVNVIKATIRLRPDLYLSFSQKTGHLIKIMYKAREQGNEVRKEHVFADFKEYDGLVLPAKMIDYYSIRNVTQKIAEWTVKSYEFPDKLPPSPIDEPKKK
jgi:hypothetical protein